MNCTDTFRSSSATWSFLSMASHFERRGSPLMISVILSVATLNAARKLTSVDNLSIAALHSTCSWEFLWQPSAPSERGYPSFPHGRLSEESSAFDGSLALVALCPIVMGFRETF